MGTHKLATISVPRCEEILFCEFIFSDFGRRTASYDSALDNEVPFGVEPLWGIL